MHRTDGADNVENKFTDEIPGTAVTANWLNAVQEEICGVVEGAGISLNSPSTDTANQLLAAIISLIDGAVAARVLEDHPIGSVYAQFPAVGSNTESEAFPVADRPATKYGGTWTEIFNTENVFFRTAGTDYQTRNFGLSLDEMQQIIGSIRASGSGFTNDTTSPTVEGAFTCEAAGALASGNGIAGNGTSTGKLNFNSANSTGARTGAVTEPRNRLMKLWKRTA